MSMRHVWVALVLLAGCAGVEGGGVGWSRRALGGDASESDLAAAVLGLANGAARADLINAGLDTRQADNVIAARPIASIDALGAVAYVGDAALRKLLVQVAPDAVAAGAGFWDEVLLASGQVPVVLDIANEAELLTLGCDLGFTSSMAQRIVDGRVYATVDQLVAVPYFGKSQLERLKSNIAWWTSGDGATGGRFDCVSFTPAQEAAALQVANGAGYSQLGGYLYDLLAPGRAHADLASVAAVSGIGPTRMKTLRGLADAVIAGTLALRPDSVVALAGGGTSIDVYFPGGVRVVEADVHGGVYRTTFGSGVVREIPCARVADPNDSTPNAAGHSALYCHGAIQSQFLTDLKEVTGAQLDAWAQSQRDAAASGATLAPGVLRWQHADNKGPFLFQAL